MRYFQITLCSPDGKTKIVVVSPGMTPSQALAVVEKDIGGDLELRLFSSISMVEISKREWDSVEE